MSIRYKALRQLLLLEKKGFQHLIIDYDVDTIDNNLLKELVFGVLRFKERLDFVVKKLSNEVSTDPYVLWLLRLAIYQVLYLDRIPFYAIHSETMKICGSKYISAMLWRVSREKNKLLEDLKNSDEYYCFPDWFQKYYDVNESYLKDIGFRKDFIISKTLNCIRVNTALISIDKLIEMLPEDITYQLAPLDNALVVKSGFGKLLKHEIFKKGYCTVQGLSSQLVSITAEPCPDMSVLDLCAAPGGKTCHMASLMHNTGQIVATDASEGRLELVSDNCQRLGVTNVEVCKDVPNKLFDIVLVDPPCSSLGVIGKYPELKYRMSQQKLSELKDLQLSLLEKGFRHLKSTGKLVYSVCTFSKEETALVTKELLNKFPLRMIRSFYTWQLNELYEGFYIAVFSKEK